VSDEHSTLDLCFHGLAVSLAAPALGAAACATPDSTAMPKEGKRAIVDFLQFAEPGEDALRKLSSLGIAGVLRRLLGNAAPSPYHFARFPDWPLDRLELRDDFFTTSRLRKVAVLAARLVGEGWSAWRHRVAGEEERSLWFLRRTPTRANHVALGQTLDLLSFWSRNPAPKYLETFDSDELVAALAPWENASPGEPLKDALTEYSDMPRDADAIALWLAGDMFERPLAPVH